MSLQRTPQLSLASTVAGNKHMWLPCCRENVTSLTKLSQTPPASLSSRPGSFLLSRAFVWIRRDLSPPPHSHFLFASARPTLPDSCRKPVIREERKTLVEQFVLCVQLQKQWAKSLNQFHLLGLKPPLTHPTSNRTICYNSSYSETKQRCSSRLTTEEAGDLFRNVNDRPVIQKPLLWSAAAFWVNCSFKEILIKRIHRKNNKWFKYTAAH